MTKEQALNLLFGKNTEERALNTASALLHWDATTSGVPEKSLTARSEVAGWLSGESFRRFIAPDTLDAVETLEALDRDLDEKERAMVREISRKYRKLKAVPPEEMQAFSTLIAESETIWETAREKSDFTMMLPYYEKIFDFQRRLCDWYGYEKHPYDALLGDYEKGADVEMLDGFFGTLREKIVPLLRMIAGSDRHPREVSGLFDIQKQKELQPWLCEFVGYDRTRGKIGEVEHPYCLTINRNDVRITTKYHEDNLFSALYSTVHESGHALYEQNMDENLTRYGLNECASMGFHESQSRMFENMICRSSAFCGQLLPKLRGQFDYFKDWNEDELYGAVNIARPSLIRIEADELTYCLHIMVRYELEKALITGDIKVADLPNLWADSYAELLGVRPENDAVGVLQDTHWSGGMVGYFPSYAVGNAYAAQLMHAMKKVVDVDGAIAGGDISPVTGWLKENVHCHGAVLLPDALIELATGEAFNPDYYADYLYEKFTALY